MLRVIKLALLPIKYVWILGIVLALGLGTGIINVPGGASAQVAPIDCQDDRQCDQQPEQPVETDCPNGQNRDQTCIEDTEIPEEPADEPQVLGETTTAPQVLAETTGK